jgi:excinuclease ABC subunit C
LAKDDRHRTHELLYGFPAQVIGMKTESPLFHLLTHIQDEVHRFAITFHRQKRSKHQVASELDEIKGIGPRTRDLLIKHFRSVKRIREASDEELTTVIGVNKTKIIREAFAHNKENA